MNPSTSLATSSVAGAAAIVLLGVAKAVHVPVDADTAVAAVTLISAAAHTVHAYLASRSSSK